MSFLNKAILSIGCIVSNIATFGTSQSDQSQESDKKVLAIAHDAFSKTGELTQKQRHWSEKANPFYALFNCQNTSSATALMLETGEMNPVSIRPVAFCSIWNMEKYFPKLFQNISGDKGCFRTSCKRDNLDTIMLLLGQGTHAIIDGTNKRFSRTGHLFNYALVKHEETYHFEIIESYGGSYTKMARENIDEFFDGYEPEIGAIVFYNKTPNSSLLIEEIMRGLPVEHLASSLTNQSETLAK